MHRPSRKKKRHHPRPRKPAPERRRLWRFYFVFALFAAIGLAVAFRLVFVQVVESAELTTKARQSRNQASVLYNRGRILDRNGVILAQDSILYDLYAHPGYYHKATPQQIASAIAPVLSMSETTLTRMLDHTRESMPTIRVARNIPKSIVDQILDTRITIALQDSKTNKPLIGDDGQPMTRHIPVPGMDFSKKTVRNYPQGSLAAHILGYVNDEADISAGVERTAAHILKKRPDALVSAELDGRGGVIQMERLNPEALVTVPKAEDVTLTIDSRLQYISERELEAGIERSKAKRGAVIMMDPRTGEILSFAVWPRYAPDQFHQAPSEHLKNWAITDVYPPGSTMKILTVACGLETGVINRNTRILDTGRMRIGGWNIENYDYYKRPHPGMIDLVYLLQHSSNIGSAKIAMQIPRQKYHELLRLLGIGSKTGIDLPGESSGILIPAADWDESTHASIGYGYGIASTPLQMAAAFATVANGGIWNKPYIVQNDYQKVSRRVLSKETAATVTDLLIESIETASTSTVRLREETGIRIAGKTGTSRKPRENGRGYEDSRFTSFIGYFPAEDPQVLIMVVVDSPGIGEAWGSTVAGPIFRAVARETVSYLGITPAKISAQPGQKPDSTPLRAASSTR